MSHSAEPRSRRLRVVLSSAALLPLMSVRRAVALTTSQLGIAVFFVSGIAQSAIGSSAGWVVLAAAVTAAFVRTIEIESWSLLVPGGFAGRVSKAFGPRAEPLAVATALVERLLLSALACVVVGHYVASVTATAIAGFRYTGYVRPEDFASLLAVSTAGWLWLRLRIGRDFVSRNQSRGVWIGIAILTAVVAAALIAASRRLAPTLFPLDLLQRQRFPVAWPEVGTALNFVRAFGMALTVIGGGEILSHTAADFPPPRLQPLRRTAFFTVLFVLLIATSSTFASVALVPSGELPLWMNAPLSGLAQYLPGPAWSHVLTAIAVACAAVLVLLPAAHAAMRDAEQMIQRLAPQDPMLRNLASLHTRFGTPTRAIDMTIAAVIALMLASAGRTAWLARAYAIAISAMAILMALSLLQFRRRAQATLPFQTPLNLRFGKARLPLGIIAPAVMVAAGAIALILIGDVPSISAVVLIVALAAWLTITSAAPQRAGDAREHATFDLLRSAELSLDQIEARPGNVLVPVRNPHSLAHAGAALQLPGNHDIVAMTVRLAGVDVEKDAATETAPTEYERSLLAAVVALAERHERPVRLLIVPAESVPDAIAATAIRLRSSEIVVGESSTLSADDQARMLGESWERANKPESLDVRLVVHHRSGRDDTYHLGAHPPSLTPRDLDLIHRVWLDAVKAVGPHIHHHDVVRAALTKMEQQLNGPQRDDALAAIREVARPAEELAAVIRARDYVRLRDMMRNRHASDVAELLTALPVEDQAVAFRLLPRKDAADVFEYLTQDAKEKLLKAMAQEDVAELLNNMAPDDRTLFLEELPAEATRELLALLTPAERTVARTLLGYPERSVGRLMTPNYVAVREHWTVREVLDYVRTYGHDSETLNVIYVVNDQGLLVDDVRIREFLLAPLDRHVVELMDRRFVALQATEDQESAVGVFRQYDRTALPVTDTAGALIGIVTIDDILDVAEATATREIQRIGGSEALDEPYMEIGLMKMIQKRAGWLTALFVGEMLTATAMGAFEGEISRAVVLALFVPLIISSGGNSGSQASTLVIRALALEEVTLQDWWRVMRREILAGLALGAILGSVGFLRITLWSAFSNIYGPHWLLVALTVSLSLVGVVLWGTLSGSLLPFALKRLGFDPAASSAPFVATLVDVTGLIIYFSVALLILRGTLL
jgi:magnesium transporter